MSVTIATIAVVSISLAGTIIAAVRSAQMRHLDEYTYPGSATRRPR